jgi:hypothetical protein
MEKEIKNAALHHAAAFFSLVNHPLKLRFYLLKNLPAAFFSRVKVVEANEDSCMTSVPYRWFTQNPFRSMYFACLSMAAELSTGVLAMANVYGRKPPVSMLITGMEGKFYKKAKGLVVFTCADGERIRNAIAASAATGVPQEVKAYTVGKADNGEMIAEFWFAWSFKSK